MRRAALAGVALAVGLSCVQAASAADGATGASGPGRWAPAAEATIHPGVTVTMGGVTCQAGFVLTDGSHVFLTIPAGCASIWPGEDVSGCGNTREAAGVDPPRTEATIQGAHYKGWLAYTSWARMKLTAEDRENWCHNNNLALVRVDPRDVKRVNPSIPVVGGPVRVAKSQPAAPDQLTAFLTTPANAEAIDTTSGGWAHTAMVDAHVGPSNAGAPVLTANGAALGMVTVVPPEGTIGQTTISSLRRELRALRQTSRFADVHLAKGTEEYAGPGIAL